MILRLSTALSVEADAVDHFAHVTFVLLGLPALSVCLSSLLFVQLGNDLVCVLHSYLERVSMISFDLLNCGAFQIDLVTADAGNAWAVHCRESTRSVPIIDEHIGPGI